MRRVDAEVVDAYIDPDRPGLGVELDWDWIDDNTVVTLEGLRH